MTGSLSATRENAVTSHPRVLANWSARCPGPPMPITPTREPWTACVRNGVYTVMPPHSKGAAVSLGKRAGILKTKRSFTRIVSAKPPEFP